MNDCNVSFECKECGIKKNNIDFYRASSSKTGYFSKCKECINKEKRKKYHENPEKYKKYQREYQKSYDYSESAIAKRSDRRKNGKTILTERSSKSRYPERVKARAKIRRWVKSGKIIPWPVCALHDCNNPPEAHHPDYSRPLDVVWLCKKHHAEAHVIANENKTKSNKYMEDV